MKEDEDTKTDVKIDFNVDLTEGGFPKRTERGNWLIFSTEFGKSFTYFCGFRT